MKGNRPNSELVKLLKKGDVVAFDAIYNKYCRKLHGFVLMYLKQEEDAEEIVQEVFIKIWNSRDKMDVYASFESFLFTIAYNATMSLLRKRMTEAKSREYLKSVQQIEGAEEVIDELQFKELNDQLKSLLERLTPRQKEIFELSREDGLTHAEIAQKLNISESTVNNHLVTILKFLKNNIDSGLVVSVLFFFLFLS
ncbi:RNA polymerase sigma-70 factor [Maribellus sp. CM-23]|uniref:RNA polymerase sigma factor n=1 Tax=Maribellus sp. CM-23 TaxID=2781026 RepID=UPI001F2C38A4|nr:RNA polymerase sigma-70 factor [Maribellus sp. CM-23]MCE4564692.1 RNA polymerase sigma-70 factor [Maribellus sp. CM-23]